MDQDIRFVRSSMAFRASLRDDRRWRRHGVNQHVLDYFGKSLDEPKQWTASDAVLPTIFLV